MTIAESMNKKKRIVFIIIGMAVLLVLAAIVAVSSIDVNAHKAQMEKAASRALGLDVKINGVMGVSFFPVGLSAVDVHMGNKSGEIISVAKLKLGLQLMPLMQNKIKVTSCDLINPSFNIIRGGDGKYNFESEEAAAPGPPEALSMDEIRLSKGGLIYQDRRTGERTELADLNLILTGFTIEDISGDIIRGASFEGTVQLREVKQRGVKIEDISAVVKAEKGRFAFKPLTIAAMTTENKNTGAVTELHDISLDLKNVPVSELSGDLLRSASLEGTAECREVISKDVRIEKLRMTVKAQRGVYDFTPLTIATLVVHGKKAEDKVELKEIKLEAQKVEAAGASGDMFKDLAFMGRIECRAVLRKEFRLDNISGPVKAAKGVYRIDPFDAVIFGGKAEGDAEGDLSGAADSYKIRARITGLDFEKLTEAFGRKKVIGGHGDMVTSITMNKKTGDVMKSLNGELGLHGNNLTLYSMDLDKVLSRFEETQNINLIDLGAFFIAGPLGTVATKGLGYGSLYIGAQGGRSTIRELSANWKIRNGIADSSDCALSTAEYRIALKGKLDLVRERYENVIVAILNARGCAKFSQKISGPFSDPQIGTVSTLQSIAGPLISLFNKAKDLIEGGKCDVFYKGSVRHPR